MRRVSAASAIALAAVLASCGPAPDAGPPTIAWGVDECSRCRMIISEPRYAAAARNDAGEAAKFDDVGDLVAFLREDGRPGWQSWVRGDEEDWILAERAWYVHRPDLITPMGSGLVAFASQTAARRHAKEHAGTVLSWPEIGNWNREPGRDAPAPSQRRD